MAQWDGAMVLFTSPGKSPCAVAKPKEMRKVHPLLLTFRKTNCARKKKKIFLFHAYDVFVLCGSSSSKPSQSTDQHVGIILNPVAPMESHLFFIMSPLFSTSLPRRHMEGSHVTR